MIPSGKLTVRPWQSSGLEDEFPLNIGDKIRVPLLIYQGVKIDRNRKMLVMTIPFITHRNQGFLDRHLDI